MVPPGVVCDDSPVPAFPRVPRSRDRVVAGVAAGYADRWGVEPAVVRAAVAVLALVGGLGVVGPTRMDYPGNMAAVRAVARYVGHLLAES